MRVRPLVAVLTAGLLLAPAAAVGQTGARPVVIYLHGRIVEDQGPGAVSAEFGRYEYHAIMDSLRASGFDVIGDLRPPNTDMDAYAATVATQVDSLLKAGVAPRRIAVIGFSKGGGIAQRTSVRLRRTDITFVFLAACNDAPAPFAVAGRILSVYEATDSYGSSCRTLFARARPGSVHAERRIETGLSHGAFYKALPVWLAPVRAWIRREPLE